MKIFGHRGMGELSFHPEGENTLDAFKKAVLTGVDGIELDVQLTADGHVICFHDKTIKRFIDNAGAQSLDSLKVQNLTLAQIKKLNALSQITTFQDALEFMRTQSVVDVIVDMKGHDTKRILTDRIAQSVEASGFPEERLSYCGFNPSFTHRLASKKPLWNIYPTFNSTVFPLPEFIAKKPRLEGIAKGFMRHAGYLAIDGMPISFNDPDDGYYSLFSEKKLEEVIFRSTSGFHMTFDDFVDFEDEVLEVLARTGTSVFIYPRGEQKPHVQERVHHFVQRHAQSDQIHLITNRPSEMVGLRNEATL